MMGNIVADAKRARSMMRLRTIKSSGAGKFVRRHPYATLGLAAGPGYGAVSGFRNLPGAERSRRNQEDPYLRRIRTQQQSTLFARSMGGMTL